MTNKLVNEDAGRPVPGNPQTLTVVIESHITVKEAPRAPPDVRIFEADFPISQSAHVYAQHDWFPRLKDGVAHWVCRDIARYAELDRAHIAIGDHLDKCANIIKFADAAKLRPSRAMRPRYPIAGARGWDHSTVWRDQNNSFVLLNEPYDPSDRAREFPDWCAESRWRHLRLPKGIGTYNPDRCWCFLSAPQQSRADLDAIADRLIAYW